MNKNVVRGVLVLICLVGFGGVTRAQTIPGLSTNSVGTSCGPEIPSLLPYISHTQTGAVENTDTGSAHSIVCPLADYNISGGTNYVTNVYGSDNGGTERCSAQFVNIITGATYFGSNSTAVNGLFNFTISTSIGATGTYSAGLYCSLPASNGNGAAQIWAAW